MSLELDGPPQKPMLRVIDVNVIGTIYGLKLFLHYIHKHSPLTAVPGTIRGNIIITGSEGGLYPVKQDPIYGSSKHAVRNQGFYTVKFHAHISYSLSA